MKDVGHVELERLLEFMYNGEVNIAQDQLAAFLKTAEGLKIRGLAGSSEDIDQVNFVKYIYFLCLYVYHFLSFVHLLFDVQSW